MGNLWKTTTSRMGSWAAVANYIAAEGTSVNKPACDSGGTPRLVTMPQAVDASGAYVSFKAVDAGASWTIQIRDGSDLPLTGQAAVQTGCWYS